MLMTVTRILFREFTVKQVMTEELPNSFRSIKNVIAFMRDNHYPVFREYPEIANNLFHIEQICNMELQKDEKPFNKICLISNNETDKKATVIWNNEPIKIEVIGVDNVPL